MSKGLHFLLHEKEKKTNIPTYEELLKDVEIQSAQVETFHDDLIALEVEYQTNYTKKDLDKIADYYNLNKRMKKLDLIEAIVKFENEPDNLELVYKRKKMWDYINEIKNDKYLSRYLIFD